MNEKGQIIALAVALAPVAFAAWIAKSRFVFVTGTIGALIGSCLAPSLTVEWNADATERDRIIGYAISDATSTVSGAAIGIAAGLFGIGYPSPRRPQGRESRPTQTQDTT